MSNPYTPPGAPVGDPPDKNRRPVLGAVVVGFSVDVIGSVVFSFVATLIFGVSLASAGAAPEEIQALIERSPGFQLVGMAGGLAFTVLGGYVAARFANHAEYATAFAVGIASLVFGEATMIAFQNDVLLWQRLLADLLVIPAALVGGHVRFLQKRAPA